jgi:hypothetical protein
MQEGNAGVFSPLKGNARTAERNGLMTEGSRGRRNIAQGNVVLRLNQREQRKKPHANIAAKYS